MPTEQQVISALRAWWDLGPGDTMPWDDELHEQTSFREASMRDMRAALMAAAALETT